MVTAATTIITSRAFSEHGFSCDSQILRFHYQYDDRGDISMRILRVLGSILLFRLVL